MRPISFKTEAGPWAGLEVKGGPEKEGRTFYVVTAVLGAVMMVCAVVSVAMAVLVLLPR